MILVCTNNVLVNRLPDPTLEIWSDVIEDFHREPSDPVIIPKTGRGLMWRRWWPTTSLHTTGPLLGRIRGDWYHRGLDPEGRYWDGTSTGVKSESFVCVFLTLLYFSFYVESTCDPSPHPLSLTTDSRGYCSSKNSKLIPLKFVFPHKI